MKTHALVFLAVASIAGCSEEPSTPTPTPTPDAGPAMPPEAFVDQVAAAGRVMWVAAHPDDEMVTAAVMGEIGAERHIELTFVLTTRGEKSSLCNLPEGCGDIAEVRAEEMVVATTALQGGPAKIIQLGLPDGAAGSEPGSDPADTVRAWEGAAGGYEQLIEKFRSVIESEKPGTVLIQDPRHGNTCHPDHRATAYLVIDTLSRMGSDAPPAYLSANQAWFGDGAVGGFQPGDPNDPKLITYDATRFGPAINRDTWGYLIEVMTAHASQLGAFTVDAMSASPPEHRQNYLVPLGPDGWPGEGYTNLCPVAFGQAPMPEGSGGAGGGGGGSGGAGAAGGSGGSGGSAGAGGAN